MDTIKINYPITGKEFTKSTVAIGSFDGVHLGHQKVINAAKTLANQSGTKLAVMIFDPHPLDIIDTTNSPEKITPTANKLKQLERIGVEICYIMNFTEEFALLSDQEFTTQILAKMNFGGVVVGFDFRYGKRGKGAAENLKKYAKENNLFKVEIVDAFMIDQIKVSSSRIRSLLLDGKVEEANKLLGRPFNIEGVVVKGEQRGRTIGYPTINLALKEEYIGLLNGVYVVRAYIDCKSYYGVMNVGSRPTFYENPADITYEIHLLDFNQDIYGKELEVDVLNFLRKEKRFEELETLKIAIEEDIRKMEAYVSLLYQK